MLRVAELTLNMHELLTAMAHQASGVISRIVEMTNAAFAVPLPVAPQGSEPSVTGQCDHPTGQKKRKQEANDDELVSLSPEKCATIVDCVIGELDDDLLTPPTAKQIKILHPILTTD